MLAARVIGTGADPSETVSLDRGERDGIRRNMGVITPDGVVGKVIESYRDTAQVQLLTDKYSGVGAMLAESRIQVHKFRSGAIVVSTFLALLLQAFVPVYIPKFAVLDLPLLIVVYF